MLEQIELITVLKELHNISSFRISIYDTNMNEICAYPKELTNFCKCIQENDAGKHNCIECDKQAFEKVKQSGQTYVYHCKFGLNEAVSPLYHLGILSGYLMMGQTKDNFPDTASNIYSKALPYVSDHQRLQSVVDNIPYSSRDRVLSCISILKICAAYISYTNGWKRSDQELSSKVKKYINQYYGSKITLDLLCREFNCSRSTLTASFRQAFGMTLVEYLTDYRLAQAKTLLENESLTIKRIAVTCGYTDQNYFSKVFHRYYKTTPSEYRNIINK